MAVDLSLSPYFDDYDENKNFHRILFVPGRAVQTREVNQLQKILQTQIGRFGKHVFEEGSMVIPGEFNYDMNSEYIRVSGVQFSTIKDILANNTVIVRGMISGITAQIFKYVENVGTDPITFYLKYNTGSGSDISRFIENESIQLETESGTVFSTATVDSSGQGATFTINKGVFFINDMFIQNDAETIVLAKYNSVPSVVVGFRLSEEIIKASDDPSLFDNAAGSTNFNAIGADRLRETLILESYNLTDEYDKSNFIELAKFKNGILQTKARGPEYSVLADELARRTYDESGDYTVNAFKCFANESLKDEDHPDGIWTAEEGGLEEKYAVAIEPGKAYIRGYEIESYVTDYIAVDKARDTKFINNSTFSLPIGNVIIVDSMSTLPLHNQFQKVDFYAAIPSSPGSIPSGSPLGSARVRWARYNSLTGTAEIYLFNFKNAAGQDSTAFLGTAKSMYAPGSPAFTAILKSELLNTGDATSVFKLPVKNVKTLLDENGESDTSVTVGRQFTGTTDATGSIVIVAGANEVFEAAGPNSSIAVTKGGTTTIDTLVGISSLSGTPVGTTMTIELGSGQASASVVINTTIIKQVTNVKPKTLGTSSVSHTTTGSTNTISLGKADVYEIVSILDQDNVDHASKFTLVPNDTPEYYGISFVRLKSGASIASGRNLTIAFKYFIHGSGDYISVDSYAAINYADIGNVNIVGQTVSMSDVIDFRPRINDAGTLFSGSGSSLTDTPIPNSVIRNDITYYLPRIDKVYVQAKKGFGVLKGVSSDKPVAPETPEDSMAIYTLEVPAYTKNVKDIKLNFLNNRRYTMRDIGKLDARIANVEYYTTLNMLEAETASLQVVDPITGLNRFKNGFMVDNFVDHSVGYFSLPDYKCSISSKDKMLRAEFSQDFVDFSFDLSASTGVQRTGDLITLPYTENTFLNQPLASTYVNVNPYAVYKWQGIVTLTPSSDAWFDTRYTEPEVTYSILNNGNLEQQWQSWSLNWTGEPVSSTSDTSVSTTNNGSFTSTTTTTTTTTTGVTVEQIGDRIVSRTAIPYMRSRNVEFVGDGFIPSGRIYAFFDNKDVSAYCTPEGGALGAPLFTDADGIVRGTFSIPNSEAMKFRTGTKNFTLIDNAENVKETSLSYGDATFTSSGTLITRTQSISATKTIETSSVSSTTTRNVPQNNPFDGIRDWQQNAWERGGGGGGDPLAQSFFVETTGGIFVTSIEIYFQSKSDTTPVSVEIRDMVNGYPGPNIVPYSQKVLKPSEVNVSADASAVTKFVLPAPVYLSSGNEYCFVIKSNSNDYNVWIGTMGQKVVNQQAWISKQPYVGVMFKSQNNTTWSEDQESDIKFTINTAKFTTDTAGKAVFRAEKVGAITLVNNPLSATAGSGLVNIRIPNHNLIVDSRFRISGVVSAPGLALGDLNKQQTVVNVVSPDEVQFSVASTANASTDFGGDGVSATYNIQFSTFHAVVSELLFQNTELDWGLQGYSGKSFDGTEVPYILQGEFSIQPNSDQDLTSSLLVGNADEAAAHTQGNTLNLNGNVVSFLENLSPVIDLNRVGLIAIANRINYPDDLEETEPTGGNAFNRYITNIIGIKNAAESLKAYLDVYQPTDSIVKMFYRIGNSENEVSTSDWTELPNIMSQYATGINVHTEFEYGEDDLTPFTFYQFKIVLLSKSNADIPTAKRLRGIALGT